MTWPRGAYGPILGVLRRPGLTGAAARDSQIGRRGVTAGHPAIGARDGRRSELSRDFESDDYQNQWDQGVQPEAPEVTADPPLGISVVGRRLVPEGCAHHCPGQAVEAHAYKGLIVRDASREPRKSENEAQPLRRLPWLRSGPAPKTRIHPRSVHPGSIPLDCRSAGSRCTPGPPQCDSHRSQFPVRLAAGGDYPR